MTKLSDLKTERSIALATSARYVKLAAKLTEEMDADDFVDPNVEKHSDEARRQAKHYADLAAELSEVINAEPKRFT